MHVIAKHRQSVDHVNNVASKIPRMRSSKPYPPNPGHRGKRSQQLGKALLTIRIAIRVNVLPEQLNFRIPEVSQLPRFLQNRSGSPAALLAARIRNHAISAKLIASFDNRDIPAMRIRARGKLRLEALVGQPVVKPGNARS